MQQLDNQKILECVIKHLDDVNSIVSDSNFLNAEKLLEYIKNRDFNLGTSDPNLYLASLLQKRLFNMPDVVKVTTDESERILLISFVNTVLEELELKGLEYIVE